MRRGAVIAVNRAAVLAVALAVSGCAGFHPLQRGGGSKTRAASLASRAAESQELSKKAQAAIDRHENAEAVQLLRQLVATEPKSAEAHHRLGRVLQTQGHLPEAEAEYRRALDLDHDYVAAVTALGSIEEAQRHPAAALTRFDDAIDLDPNQAEAHLLRGRALEELGRTDEALAAYFRTLEFAPNSTEARLRVATMQLARDEPDQALARLDALTDEDPENAEARHQRGRAHLALNHLPQALDDLKFAAGKLPARADVHFHLAVALAADHETTAALASAERALTLAPNYTEARALSQKLRR